MVMHRSLVWVRLVGSGKLIDIDKDAGKVILSLPSSPYSKSPLRMIGRLSHALRTTCLQHHNYIKRLKKQ